jgi:hypothetical protein
MNKLITTFLFILLGLCALMFYNVDQLRKELDTQALAITQLDNRLFMLQNRKENVTSAQNHGFRLYDITAKFKDQPYCEKPEGEDYAVVYGDMKTNQFRSWKPETQAESFSLDKQKVDVTGKFVIDGYDIMVDVTTSDDKKIKASFSIIDMQPNGDILAFQINSRVRNIKNCPQYIIEAF